MSAHALFTPRAPPSCRRSILSAHASHSCLRGHLRHVAVSARWRAQTDARSSDHLVITIIILSGICFPQSEASLLGSLTYILIVLIYSHSNLFRPANKYFFFDYKWSTELQKNSRSFTGVVRLKRSTAAR